jgi:hypothetical protein
MDQYWMHHASTTQTPKKLIFASGKSLSNDQVSATSVLLPSSPPWLKPLTAGTRRFLEQGAAYPREIQLAWSLSDHEFEMRSLDLASLNFDETGFVFVSIAYFASILFGGFSSILVIVLLSEWTHLPRFGLS